MITGKRDELNVFIKVEDTKKLQKDD